MYLTQPIKYIIKLDYYNILYHNIPIMCVGNKINDVM